jgi:hypothetical protein
MLMTIPSAAERLPSDMLIDIALCEELFHTAAGAAFADIIIEGHRETWPIRSKRFRAWLRRPRWRSSQAAVLQLCHFGCCRRSLRHSGSSGSWN